MDWYDEEEARASKNLVKVIIFIAVIATIAACVVKYF
jgi:hypothetical protein